MFGYSSGEDQGTCGVDNSEIQDGRDVSVGKKYNQWFIDCTRGWYHGGQETGTDKVHS